MQPIYGFNVGQIDSLLELLAQSNTLQLRIAKAIEGVSIGVGSGGSMTITREDVSGTKDGSNTSFSISKSTYNAAWIFHNGLLLRENTGYTISGANITMISAPKSTDTFEAIILEVSA